jgi:hypothetical protein
MSGVGAIGEFDEVVQGRSRRPDVGTLGGEQEHVVRGA